MKSKPDMPNTISELIKSAHAVNATNGAVIDRASLAPASSTPAGHADHALEQLHFPDIPLPPQTTLPSLLDLRLQKGDGVDNVAASLRLSQAQIHALEAQNWAVLPSGAYIKGFLRNYARYLGVAPEPYIEQYEASVRAEHGNADQAIAAPPPLVLHKEPTALSSFSATSHQKQSQQSLFSVVALLIAGTLAFLLFWERALWLPKLTALAEPVTQWVGQHFASPAPAVAAPPTPAPSPSPAPAPVPSATAPEGAAPSPASLTLPTETATTAATNNTIETPAAPAVASGVSAASAAAITNPASPAKPSDAKPTVPNTPSTVTKPATGPIRALSFQMDKTVWLEVRDSGNNIIYYGTKTAGTKDTIKGAAPLSVVVGAADALKMNVDGVNVDVKAQSIGNVARLKIQ